MTEMYQKLYRRLRVLLHRYPLLPFLLAATLAVDLLAVFFHVNNPTEGYQSLIVGSLVSQFCLIGVWIVHRFRSFGFRLGTAVIFISGYLMLMPFKHKDTAAEIAVMAAVVSITSALTHLSINFMLRLTKGRVRKISIPRFSIKDLLVLSTTTAMLVYALKKISLAQYPPHFPVVLLGVAFLITVLWHLCSMNSKTIRVIAPCLCYALLGLAVLLPDAGTISDLFAFGILVLGYYILFEIGILKFGMVGFVLIWYYGLQFRRRPIRQRRKKQQATSKVSKQPVESNVVNQEDEPEEPLGPIDLTV